MCKKFPNHFHKLNRTDFVDYPCAPPANSSSFRHSQQMDILYAQGTIPAENIAAHYHEQWKNGKEDVDHGSLVYLSANSPKEQICFTLTHRNISGTDITFTAGSIHKCFKILFVSEAGWCSAFVNNKMVCVCQCFWCVQNGTELRSG